MFMPKAYKFCILIHMWMFSTYGSSRVHIECYRGETNSRTNNVIKDVKYTHNLAHNQHFSSLQVLQGTRDIREAKAEISRGTESMNIQ